MSWIQSEEDGDAFTEAQALGAHEVVLASKRRVTKFLDMKREIGITIEFNFDVAFGFLRFRTSHPQELVICIIFDDVHQNLCI